MAPSVTSTTTDTPAPVVKVPGVVGPISIGNGSAGNGAKKRFGTTSMIESKFLSNPDKLGIVPVAFSGGQRKAGVDIGPTALIESGLLSQLRDELGYGLHGGAAPEAGASATTGRSDAEAFPAAQYTDLVLAPEQDPPHRGMHNPRTVSAVARRIADQCREHAAAGRLVVTLGGDHSIAIGTIGGVAAGTRDRLGKGCELAVVWVDAHSDINTPETSDSGNIHGMPVAFLTGLATESHDDMFGWIRDEHRINISKLVYIGLRDVDAGEKRILREHGVKAFSMHDIDRFGIGRVMEMALGHIGSHTPIHLSFDIDSLDPMWAPSTGTPVRGGLTLREGDFICECLHETGSLVAVDLVEVNPSLAASDEQVQNTIRAASSLIRCSLGESLL